MLLCHKKLFCMSQSAVTLFVGIVLYVVTDGPAGLVFVNKLVICKLVYKTCTGSSKKQQEEFIIFSSPELCSG